MLKIHVPAKLESLGPVNTFIEEALPIKYHAIRPQIELVLEEILVNIFSYAYKNSNIDEASANAEITCVLKEQAEKLYCCVSVRDWGTPFNPFENAPEPDLSLDVEHRPIGGLGVHIIKTIVASYSYHFIEESNFIELFFALPDK